jgi:hypothetical protein
LQLKLGLRFTDFERELKFTVAAFELYSGLMVGVVERANDQHREQSQPTPAPELRRE